MSVLAACWAPPEPRLVLLLCWRESPGQPGISAPRPARGKDLRRAPGGPGIRPAARDTPVPARWRFPAATRHTGGPAGRRTTRTLSKHHPCAPGAALHHHSAPRPGADRTTHSDEKRLLSISKSRRSPNRNTRELRRACTRPHPLTNSSARLWTCRPRLAGAVAGAASDRGLLIWAAGYQLAWADPRDSLIAPVTLRAMPSSLMIRATIRPPPCT